MSKIEALPTKGVYTLIIFVNKKSRLKVHRLGCFNLQKGYYAYTGSAMGDGAVSLRRRIERHLKERKTKHWHIDFLLANRSTQVAGVVTAESKENKECQVNNLIKNIEGAKVFVVGFGASDCKQNCKSHLLYCGEEDVEKKIVNKFLQLFEPDKVFYLPSIPQ